MGTSGRSQPKRRERKVSGRITLADVARIAGIAKCTASRAMNSPEMVSPEVLQRVQDAVARTGYVPNLLAGGLASNRSRLIAAIIPAVSGVFASFIQAASDELAASGYQLTLGVSGYADSREDELIRALISRRPDGLIITGIVHSREGRLRLASAGIPIVETWDFTSTPIDMLVGFSHEKIGAAIAEFLHARGAHEPGIITANDPRAELRARGFVEKAKVLGMSNAVLHSVPAPAKVSDGSIGLRDLLRQAPNLDAVVCSSDYVAMGVLLEAQLLGLLVPKRLAVIAFGDLDFAAQIHPALTSVRIDGVAIGRNAAQLILEKIAGHPRANRAVDVGFQIIARESA